MADEKLTPGSETSAVSPEAQSPSAQLRDKRPRPEGVVPKQAQGYVMAGLAVLILMAVMFSKNHAKPAPKDTVASPLAASTDANQRKIQELEQDLSADQRQSQQQALSERTSAPLANSSTINPATGQPVGTAAPAMQLAPPSEPPRDQVADAEKAMAFRARFASNLVTADDGAARPSVESLGTGEDAPARSSSLQPTSPTQSTSAAATAASKRAPEVNVNSAHGQPYVVFEGTSIDTVLPMTRGTLREATRVGQASKVKGRFFGSFGKCFVLFAKDFLKAETRRAQREAEDRSAAGRR